MPEGLDEEAHRPDAVHGQVVDRPLDRDAHVGLGREVEAHLGPHLVEETLDLLRLPHVGDDEARAGVNPLAAARREVVEHRDLVSSRHERVDDVRADETGAPCHDRSHRAYPTALRCS